MSVEKRRQIAQKGGIIAHKRGVAHEFNQKEAKKYGRIGGQKKRLSIA